jgi:uncharacterized membrane protein YqiK
MVSSLIMAGVVLVGLITLGLIFTKLYKKSTKEMAFIRTGLGGEKVIMNGGAVVLPILHEIMKVNMNTLKLEINRKNEQALITRDRLRVDVLAEFYVRVKLDKDSISRAAQTLGTKTLNPMELKNLVEGKFVDALRSVAAEMDMEELHEKRVDFVQKVQIAVSEDLTKNGLELESVSLTGLDQTDRSYFNPENAFDAEGLKKLAESIEKRRKERNAIEKDTALEIQRKNLQTEKESLTLSQEQETARLDQEREIAKKTASQEAEIAKEQSESKKAAESARISAEEEIQRKEIQKDKSLEEERIIKEKLIQEKEIEKRQSIEAKEIEKSKVLETQKVEKEKTIAIAEQDKQIQISNKSKEESLAKKEANEAKALEVESEQKAITAAETEIAEREKTLELIEADKNAEKERTMAKGKADAIVTEAEAQEKKYKIDAEGRRLLIESENGLSEAIIAMKLKQAMIEALPSIIAQVVKPMENIDSIKIVDMQGMNQGTTINGSVVGEKSLPDQVVDASLRHRVNLPIVNDLMNEVGFDMSSVANMVGSMKFSENPKK